MDNPARELLRRQQMLQASGLAGHHGHDARGYPSQQPGVIAEDLASDAALLIRTRDCIDRLEKLGTRVSVFRGRWSKWAFGVFSYPVGWTTQGIDTLYLDHDLEVLELLADQIDSRRALNLTPDQIGDLEVILDRADALVADDGSISQQLQAYLSELLREIRYVGIANSDGSFDLRQALERLWVALYAAAGQSTEKKSAWEHLAKDVWYPAAAGFLASLPGVVVSLAQLTQGGN